MSGNARRHRRKPTTSTARLVDALLGRRHKYAAKRTEVDGISFASRKEARRYSELKLLERAGKIENLRRQVRFALVQTVVYVADFQYVENGETVVEDVKGYRTAEYKRKRRLMKEQHGVEVRET
jgi:hypothetical protein